METLGDEAHLTIYQTNVMSNLGLARLVKRDMEELGGGNIALISSIAGFKGTSTIDAYAISKAAEVQLARNHAVEWGLMNIPVNCIAPALFKTTMAAALLADEELKRFTRKTQPLRRLGEPDDIAGVAVLLMAEAGKFITGQTMIVDGGALVA
jgi:NAD(P)-dependent dehydrogenase (short-subunit alcohol dehydrogenase family)